MPQPGEHDACKAVPQFIPRNEGAGGADAERGR